MFFDVDFSPILNMDPEENKETKEEDAVIGVDFSAFTKEGGSTFTDDMAKKTRKKKAAESAGVTGEVLPAKVASRSVAPEENQFMHSYEKTNALLEGAIVQTDILSSEIKEDIDTIRASKTLKNKYTYITNLTSSASSLIATKIQAIKEINGTISQAHKLELDRMKQMKDAEKDQSDDSRMMDLYKAFVNTPVGTYNTPAMPTIGDSMLAGAPMGNNVTPVSMGGLDNGQLTPEQMRMRMESDPNIMTVVKFNQTTGERYFDVINRTNGGSIPNYPRPDPFLLDDTVIDVHAMSARNKNLDIVWPLVFIGEGNVSEY
mgnify:FL=1